MDEKFGNPRIFALGSFGFVLAVAGTMLTIAPEAAIANRYAVLFGALGETIGGLWLIAEKETYEASIFTTFGLWLVGLFFLLGGPNDVSMAVYWLTLLPLIVFLWIPARKKKLSLVLRGAFVALFFFALFLGLAHVFLNDTMEVAAGAFAYLSAIFIWWLCIENVYKI